MHWNGKKDYLLGRDSSDKKLTFTIIFKINRGRVPIMIKMKVCQNKKNKSESHKSCWNCTQAFGNNNNYCEYKSQYNISLLQTEPTKINSKLFLYYNKRIILIIFAGLVFL